MIADAFRAETLKLRANRSVLLWGFVAAPLITFAFGLGGSLFVWATVPMAGAVGRPPLLTDMTGALSAAGNPIWHVFYIMAAATLFAGEYRWETWRFIVPRNRRRDLLAGKLAAFAAFAAASIALILIAGLAVTMIDAVLHRAGAAAHPDPAAGWAAFLMMYAVGLAQLCAVASITALVAVITRSLLGAVMTVFLLGLAQAMFIGMFGEAAGDPRFIAALPNLAAGTARDWAAQIAGDPDASSTYGPLAAAALLAWIAAPIAAAMAIFSRQDLAQE
jgi:ABC-2 type transport system permease protein